MTGGATRRVDCEVLRDFREARIVPRVSGYASRDVSVGGVPCEVVRANGTLGGRRILYFHGGGYLRGEAKEYRGVTVPLAHASGSEVVTVNYRLAPEWPFPAAYEDCLIVYTALGASLDAVIGDSAGGALAVAVLIGALKAGLKMPSCVIAHTPMADLQGRSRSLTDPNFANPSLSSERVEWLMKTYLSLNRVDPWDWRHSPLYGDLAGLPRLLIQVAGRDPLHDDGTRLAQRATRDGVDTIVSTYENSGHCWAVRGTNPPDPVAVAAIEEWNRFISLGGTEPSRGVAT